MKAHSVDKQKISEATKKAMENVDMKSIMCSWAKNNKHKAEERNRKLSEAFKGRLPSNKGKTGKHWHLENGVRIWTGEWK